MVWDKADKGLIELLEKALEAYSCDRKFMFGSPTFFINNNMFAGVHQHTVILCLSETDRKEITATHAEAKPFEPMPLNNAWRPSADTVRKKPVKS